MKSPTVGVSTDTMPRLGRYVDLVLLGQGGMGAVYRGRDPDLDRPVAIKVVLDANADFVERFRREAKAVARLHHPNIVQVYDFGQDEAGHPFFVMELVEGRPLDALLAERGRFSPDEVASVLAQAAAGLQAAHEGGIIHRDVKPSNLILDAKGRIKLVDFGIARLDNTPMLTSPSSLLGTPTYMSPEQVAGKPLDGRSDLYSLGVSCFHLLAGQPPFESREPIALALMHLNDPLPSVAERAPGTPPPLAALIVRLCAKDPAQRPATGKEVLAEVERISLELGGPSRPLAAVVAEGAVASAHVPTVPPTRAGQPEAEAEAKPFPTVLVGGIGAVLAAAATVGVVMMLHKKPSVPDPVPAAVSVPVAKNVAAAMPPTEKPAGGPIVEKASAVAAPTGPVRVAVLKFKNLGGDKDLDFLVEGIGETVLTELAGASDKVALVERNQVAAETGEIDFDQTKYVDKSTAAALGKLAGVEIAVQGGFQRAGKTVRASARFVRVETGEILDTVVVTRPAAKADQLFSIQDAVVAELKKHLLAAAAKVRG